MIIIEGPDNAGKTTLANKIGLPIVHPGSAPKNVKHELELMMNQWTLASKPIIHDRVTAISQPVYNTLRPNALLNQAYGHWVRKMLEQPHCMVIYCRPPNEVVLDMSNHEVKEHDSPEHIKFINDNQAHFVRSYDLLMSFIPHTVYDYTNDKLDIQYLHDIQNDYLTWHKFSKRKL